MDNLGVEVASVSDLDEDDNDGNDSSELMQFRYNYWSDLLKYINSTSYKDILKTENRKSSSKKCYDFYLGTSDCNLYVRYDNDNPSIGYWIKSKSLYDKFLLFKNEIEQECGVLKWSTMNKASKIIKELSFAGKTKEEQFELIINELIKMQELFMRYIK